MIELKQMTDVFAFYFIKVKFYSCIQMHVHIVILHQLTLCSGCKQRSTRRCWTRRAFTSAATCALVLVNKALPLSRRLCDLTPPPFSRAILPRTRWAKQRPGNAACWVRGRKEGTVNKVRRKALHHRSAPAEAQICAFAFRSGRRANVTDWCLDCGAVSLVCLCVGVSSWPRAVLIYGAA